MAEIQESIARMLGGRPKYA